MGSDLTRSQGSLVPSPGLRLYARP
jgi:hypothetical protein